MSADKVPVFVLVFWNLMNFSAIVVILIVIHSLVRWENTIRGKQEDKSWTVRLKSEQAYLIQPKESK